MRLKLADDLTLPADAATQTFLIVGKRGSGKSSTAKRMAEQFHHAGVPFVVIDPVDKWHGLKSSADGKHPGLPVYVFGGSHADLPLEPAGGTLVADTIVEHRISAVLAIKTWSSTDRARFLIDFTARLFQKNTEPLHVFMEEAHEIAPQRVFHGQERMLHHVERLWKLGRSSGLGGSAITQRPASLNKDITTQAEVLIVHRTIGPQDVAAVKEWIKYHSVSDEILSRLSSLRTGEAIFWAPDFPEDKPIGLREVHVLMPETFDSFKTPKAGERAIEPKALAPVDLDRLRKNMAATIEKAKADDPRELRKRILELEAELRQRVKGVLMTGKAPKVREVPILKDGHVKRLEVIFHGAEKLSDRTAAAIAELAKAAAAVRDDIRSRLPLSALTSPAQAFAHGRSALALARAGATPVRGSHGADPVRVSPQPDTWKFAVEPEPGDRGPARFPIGKSPKKVGGPHNAGVDNVQQRILDTIAMLNVRRLPLSREAIARWMSVHPRGGRYNRALAALRAAEHLEGLQLTDSGLKLAHGPAETGLEGALRALPDETKRRVLQAVVDSASYLSKEELAEKLGVHPRGGRFNRDLAWLRTMGVITDRGPIAATEGLER
jgi:hypothetical protein